MHYFCAHPSFKDYFRVRPSAFRWWKNTCFNQVNAAMPYPFTLPPLRINLHVYHRTTFMRTYTLWKRCHRVPTGSSNYRSLSMNTFLADWFQEKCWANFEVSFSTLPNEARPSCRAFDVKKNTQHRALCIFQQILSDVKSDALRDLNVCHDV